MFIFMNILIHKNNITLQQQICAPAIDTGIKFDDLRIVTL
jgi:hypothetical protein